MERLRLTKHHGAGNDFLVLLDLDRRYPVAPETIRAWCDRNRGIGADGFMRVLPGVGTADVTMHLFNADGSRPEMSGNGIRCLAQAVLDAGLVAGPDLTVLTDAGLRHLMVRKTGERLVDVSVDMGQAKVSVDIPEWATAIDPQAIVVDVGNPHLVLPVKRLDVEIAALGPRFERLLPNGLNVEWVMQRPGGIAIRIWERGVGETLACGTGTCAAATAAAAWGWASREMVEVDNPGGTLLVDLRGDTLVLTGPAYFVGAVELPWP